MNSNTNKITDKITLNCSTVHAFFQVLKLAHGLLTLVLNVQTKTRNEPNSAAATLPPNYLCNEQSSNYY